jgi:hypothetical protein
VSEGVVDDIEDGRGWPLGNGLGDGDGAGTRPFCPFCAFWQSHLEG